MKQLGLNANSICLLRKIYQKIFQKNSPPQNLVSALRSAIYGYATLFHLYLLVKSFGFIFQR